jgi:catechol 2,3-dioxygenase-like lactoylglutathione lyase family enzyme
MRGGPRRRAGPQRNVGIGKGTGMKRVIGIGGVFIKSKQRQQLLDWYRDHLGLDVQDWGGAVFAPDAPARLGLEAGVHWSVFESGSEYFAPSTAPFMLNFVVEDLDAVLAALREEGCNVDPRHEESEFGRFGWVIDPDGNRIELWQPPLKRPE